MQDKTSLINLLKFVDITNLFANVYRKTITNKDGTFENNAQHSFQISLVAWYLCSVNNLDLNIDKLFRYGLIHDLVEVYSGNFPAYKRNESNQQTKTDLESKALLQIKKDFNDFPELTVEIENYNKQNDAESKFIYALDKLLPILNIEVNNIDFYYQSKTTFEDMLEVKDKKIAKDKTVYGYFEILKAYLKDDVEFFWPDCKNRDYSDKQKYSKHVV